MQKNQINSNGQTEYQLKLLSEIVTKSLSEDSDENIHVIFFFIKRILRQFRLDRQFQESDILIETYLRIRKKIESEESIYIRNMQAYFKSVAFNIVREKSRERKKADYSLEHLIDHGYGFQDKNSEIDDSGIDQISKLSKALKKLSDEDFELIQLRIIKGLSWNQINDYINHSKDNINNKKLSVSTLRKRGERALKRLREAYFSIENQLK